MKTKTIWLILGIIVALFLLYVAYKATTKTITISSERYSVKCVPDCSEEDICIKGACVKKKINYL